MMSIREFLYYAHSENGRPSSKRLYGGIGWIVIQTCLLTACILSFIKGEGITEILKDLFFFDLSISATLLGLSTITGVFGRNSIQTSSEPVKTSNLETVTETVKEVETKTETTSEETIVDG